MNRAVETRQKFTSYILQLVRESAKNGQPIVRSMEYEFPNQGFAEIKGQFMLGEKFLVAPILTKDTKKLIYFPKGRWKSDKGEIVKGPTRIEQLVPLDRLPVYELVK